MLHIFIAAAQLPQYHGQVFGEENGISGGTIQDVFIDQDQFLWAMMTYNMVRFDGKNVQKFVFEAGLTHAICDNNNRIWVLAGQQIWRNRTDGRGFEQLPFDTAGGVRLRGLFQMRNRPVTLLVSNGLYEYRPEQDKFIHNGQEIPVPGARYSVARIDTCEGMLFYAGKSSVVAFEPATGKSRILPFQNEFSHLQALTPDLAICVGYVGQSLWFDFAKGTVTRINAKKYGVSRSFENMYVTGVTAIGDKRFLVNSLLGFFHYDLAKDQFTKAEIYTEGKPVENDYAYTRINMDRYGRAWTFTNTNILVFKPLQQGLGLLRNYHTTPPHQWDNRISGLTEDDRGNIWFGGNVGFKKLDPFKNEITAYLPVPGATDRLSNPSVRSVIWDGRNIVLGPTDGGVWLFDPKTEKYTLPRFSHDSIHRKLQHEFIDYVGLLKNGDILVCGRFYVFVIKAKTYQTEIIHFPGDKANMNSVFQDSRSRIWLAAEHGIYCLDEQYRFMFKLPVPRGEGVFCFHEINDYEFLIGSRKGLRKAYLATATDTARYEPVTTFPKGMWVSTIDKDSLDRFWITTSDGLYLADERLTTFQRFDYADNIQSYIFSPVTSLRAKNGLLFLGGQNGVNYFYPEKTAKDEPPLSARLQSVEINDGDSMLYQPREPIHFAPGRNSLMFEVVAPYYNNAGKVRYRYRLSKSTEGAWVDIGTQNFFRLNDLPPGKYRLEVSAGINGKIWYDAPHPLLFMITPHFWETWWFLGIMGCCLSGLVIWFVLYREVRLKKYQQERLEIEQLKATNLKYQLETEQVLNYFNTAIATQTTVDAALWDVAKNCISQLGFEDCVIYTLDEVRNVLVQKAAWGIKSTGDDQINNPLEIPVGLGIVGTVAKSGKPALISDTSLDMRYIVDDMHRMSELSVPIILERKVIGVIDSEHTLAHFYTARHLHILTTIASLLANKIALFRAEEARRQTMLDLVDNQRKAAEAKLQSMRLQMNPHFLFNALNSIQQMIMTGNEKSATLYLSKFSKLLRMVLTHSDKDEASLREEMGMLELYVALEALRFDASFQYEITCDPEIDRNDCHFPTLIIQPFVENAIWHGLLHKDGPRLLSIRFTTNDEEALICTVEDNGVGRAAALEFRKHNEFRGDNHTGKGLATSAERLNVLNSRTGQHHSLDIEDLYDAAGNAAGTKVVIIFE